MIILKRGYDIFPIYDITNKTSSVDSIVIVDEAI